MSPLRPPNAWRLCLPFVISSLLVRPWHLGCNAVDGTDDDDGAAIDNYRHFQSSKTLCKSEQLREPECIMGRGQGAADWGTELGRGLGALR